MKARLTLQPGQDGTRKLVEKYGDRLLYVRYRYDPVRKRRVKTVELIEEEVPWLPEHGRLSRKTIVGIRVTASSNASRQKSISCVVEIAHETTYRLNQSRMTTKYIQP